MKIKLIRLFALIKLDIYVIVEVSQLVRFKTNIQFYCKSCSKRGWSVIIAFELSCLWLSKVNSSNLLCNVSNRNSNLIVLVCLNIFEFKYDLPLKKISGGKTSRNSLLFARELTVVLLSMF
jgi:hypothetical protein